MTTSIDAVQLSPIVADQFTLVRGVIPTSMIFEWHIERLEGRTPVGWWVYGVDSSGYDGTEPHLPYEIDSELLAGDSVYNGSSDEQIQRNAAAVVQRQAESIAGFKATVSVLRWTELSVPAAVAAGPYQVERALHPTLQQHTYEVDVVLSNGARHKLKLATLNEVGRLTDAMAYDTNGTVTVRLGRREDNEVVTKHWAKRHIVEMTVVDTRTPVSVHVLAAGAGVRVQGQHHRISDGVTCTIRRTNANSFDHVE